MYGRRMNMMVVEYFYDVCLCLEDCTSPTALWFKAGEFSTKPVPEIAARILLVSTWCATPEIHAWSGSYSLAWTTHSAPECLAL